MKFKYHDEVIINSKSPIKGFKKEKPISGHGYVVGLLHDHKTKKQAAVKVKFFGKNIRYIFMNKDVEKV